MVYISKNLTVEKQVRFALTMLVIRVKSVLRTYATGIRVNKNPTALNENVRARSRAVGS